MPGAYVGHVHVTDPWTQHAQLWPPQPRRSSPDSPAEQMHEWAQLTQDAWEIINGYCFGSLFGGVLLHGTMLAISN